MAKKTGFVQRARKITGLNFLDLVIFNHQHLTGQSLSDLCIDYNTRYNTCLSEEGINKRFNEKAIEFLKAVLELLLREQCQAAVSLLNLEIYRKVVVKDSTCFQVNESLAHEFPGSGGAGSKAGIRIQFEYDVLSGGINDLSIHAFNDQDLTDALETVDRVEEGTLIIRDLGYFQTRVFEAIDENKAFYISRLHPSRNVYQEKNGKRVKVDFEELYKKMKKEGPSRKEINIYLSQTSEYQVRLTLEVLPEKCVEERLRKAMKNARKKGRSLSGKYRNKIKFNLFITNILITKMNAEDIFTLYRLRWQIELMFKTWKSICHISKVKKVKKHRLLAYLYGRLIFILISWQLFRITSKKTLQQTGKALSFYKAAKTLKKDILLIREIIICRSRSLITYMENFYKQSLRHHLLGYHMLEKGRKKPSSSYLINLLIDSNPEFYLLS